MLATARWTIFGGRRESPSPSLFNLCEVIPCLLIWTCPTILYLSVAYLFNTQINLCTRTSSRGRHIANRNLLQILLPWRTYMQISIGLSAPKLCALCLAKQIVQTPHLLINLNSLLLMLYSGNLLDLYRTSMCSIKPRRPTLQSEIKDVSVGLISHVRIFYSVFSGLAVGMAQATPNTEKSVGSIWTLYATKSETT